MKYIDFVCPGLWVKGALHYLVDQAHTQNSSVVERG